jgi:hypothetical protein
MKSSGSILEPSGLLSQSHQEPEVSMIRVGRSHGRRRAGGKMITWCIHHKPFITKPDNRKPGNACSDQGRVMIGVEDYEFGFAPLGRSTGDTLLRRTPLKIRLGLGQRDGDNGAGLCLSSKLRSMTEQTTRAGESPLNSASW